MSDLIRGLAKQFSAEPPAFKPAGYLPAPQQARFISEAEEAAKKLPPTIKAQSLKNALLKGGAKPVELEYAGLDDFLSQNAGGSVNSSDVLKFLQEQGPLGRLRRVEQQVVDGQPPNADESPLTHEEQGELGILPKGPSYAPNFRQPFDSSTASDQTKYHEYTVPGTNGDFRGYREVLIEDPKNRPGTSGLVSKPSQVPEMSPEIRQWADQATKRLRELDIQPDGHNEAEYRALIDQGRENGLVFAYGGPDGMPRFDFPGRETPGPVDAHDADYWARYNEYPDRIAVQNIQSDIAQGFDKSSHEQEMARANSRLKDLYDMRDELMALPDSDPRKSKDLDSALLGIEDMLDETGGWGSHFVAAPDKSGRLVFVGLQRQPMSPIASNDNWKNLMARHIALQSIAGGGKPITIPSGNQMVHVEGFGLGTHSDPLDAARAATSYNEDLVRRLQKIFRGLHSSGAQVIERPPQFSEKWVNMDYPYAELGSGAPGWTIKPSPEAVRAALDRGLPIMSLAPLLLSGSSTSPADTDRR